MNKRQRSKRAWFRTRLRKKGCVRHTIFFRYDFGGIHESYTTTSLMMVSRSGKYIPLHIKFDINSQEEI